MGSSLDLNKTTEALRIINSKEKENTRPSVLVDANPIISNKDNSIAGSTSTTTSSGITVVTAPKTGTLVLFLLFFFLVFFVVFFRLTEILYFVTAGRVGTPSIPTAQSHKQAPPSSINNN